MLSLKVKKALPDRSRRAFVIAALLLAGCGRAGREAAPLEQRVHVRIAAAELAVGFRPVGLVAGRQQVRPEVARRSSGPTGCRPPRTPPRCRRPSFPTRGRNNSRPNRRRTRRGDRTAAGGAASPSPSACRSRPASCFSNASGSTTPSGSVCSFMSTSADDRYSTVAKPWLNVSAFSILSTSACRHRLRRSGSAWRTARAPAGVSSQFSFTWLGYSTKSRCDAAERRILHVDQQIMDGVAELVEQGLRVVEADQHRLARLAGLVKLLLFDASTMSSPSRPARLR